MTQKSVSFMQTWQTMGSDWPSSGSYSASNWLISGSSLIRNGVWPQWTLSESRFDPGVIIECRRWDPSVILIIVYSIKCDNLYKSFTLNNLHSLLFMILCKCKFFNDINTRNNLHKFLSKFDSGWLLSWHAVTGHITLYITDLVSKYS